MMQRKSFVSLCVLASPFLFHGAADAQSMAEMGTVGQVAGTLTSGAAGAGAAMMRNAAQTTSRTQQDAANKMNAVNDILASTEKPVEKVITPQPPSVMAAVDSDASDKISSLFFTPNQLAAIARANQGFIAPKESYDPNNQSNRPQDPGPRVVTLAGIVYQGPKDWTVWLNDERVTPKNIPDHIMGITVEKDKVHLRWMDIANQRVVNITLQSNQKYLLDSDQIVPGT